MEVLAVVLAVIIGGVLVAIVVHGNEGAGSGASSANSDQAYEFTTVPASFKLFEFRNVIVSDDRGTTEVDVILVGNTGIFIIEQKEYNAWIFGGEDDERWTARYINGSTHQFQNPLRQNYRHVMALVARLGLPKDKFHSLVAFSGDCELKTPVPSSVFVGDYYKRVKLTDGIRLTDADVSRACEMLRALEFRSSEGALDEHVGRLQERFSSTTTCPKCGAPLVQRRSTKPTSDGQPFLGCLAFPRCKYTRKISAS
jgi:hypothetical protein